MTRADRSAGRGCGHGCAARAAGRRAASRVGLVLGGAVLGLAGAMAGGLGGCRAGSANGLRIEAGDVVGEVSATVLSPEEIAAAAHADAARANHAKAPAVAAMHRPAPDFTLVDIAGVEHTLSDYTAAGRTVVLEWFNPNCPFVRLCYRDEIQRMNELEAEYADRGVVWLRVNSTNPGHPDFGLDKNQRAQAEWAIAGPILMDESGRVGRAYQARTTPHMFVIDPSGMLQYSGAPDDNRFAPTRDDVIYVKQALDAVLAGEEPTIAETTPYGCSVKYAG